MDCTQVDLVGKRYTHKPPPPINTDPSQAQTETHIYPPTDARVCQFASLIGRAMLRLPPEAVCSDQSWAFAVFLGFLKIESTYFLFPVTYISATVQFKKPTRSQIKLIKNAKNKIFH